MAETSAFIELNLRDARLRAGLRNAQKTFRRTMSRFVGFTSTAFRKIRRFFFNFRTWATLAAGAFTANKFLKAADEYRAAMMGLASVAAFNTIPALEAQKAASDLTADGLLSITDAAKSLKNLLMRGYGLPRSIEIMNRFKDAATFARQGQLSMGEAIVGATQGLKNEFSILVDNAGVTKNVSVMWREYGEQIGVTAGKLTQAQKIEAEYHGIMQETQAMLGNSALFAKIWAGQVSALGVQAKKSMADVGLSMQQTLGDLGVLDLFKQKLTDITAWFNTNKGVIIEWWFRIGLVLGAVPELFSATWETVAAVTKTAWETMTRSVRLFWQGIKLDPLSLLNDIMFITVGIGNTFARALFNILKILTVSVAHFAAMIGTTILHTFDLLGKTIGHAVFNGLQSAKGHLNTFVGFINDKFGLNIKPLEVTKIIPLNFGGKLQNTMAAVGLSLESEWDSTITDMKTTVGETVDDIINDMLFMGEALQDPLSSRNWEIGAKQTINTLDNFKDRMFTILNGIKTESKKAGEIALENLRLPPGAGRVAIPKADEGPILGPKFDATIAKKARQAWDNYFKTIAGQYQDHTANILNADHFSLAQKKMLLAEEETAFIALGGTKEQAARLFSQTSMDIERERLEEIMSLNKTSEATMHEARMGFLETYMQAFQTANASMEEMMFRLINNYMTWYTGAFASAAEQIVIDGKNIKNVLHDVGMSFKRMMVRWAADYVAQRTLSFAFEKTAMTAYLAQIKAAQLSQLGTAVPLAAAVSLYSFGANAPPAMAGMSSASALAAGLFAPKMHEGGLVDDRGAGRGNERLRLLRQGEFVVRNDRRNLQVEVPQRNAAPVTNNITVSIHLDNLDRDNVQEVGEELAEVIREKLNEQVSRGETLRASEVADAA